MKIVPQRPADQPSALCRNDGNAMLPAVLPCPFCGGEPYEGKANIESSQGCQYTIKCYNCGVLMTHDRRDKVRGHWNQRASKA